MKSVGIDRPSKYNGSKCWNCWQLPLAVRSFSALKIKTISRVTWQHVARGVVTSIWKVNPCINLDRIIIICVNVVHLLHGLDTVNRGTGRPSYFLRYSMGCTHTSFSLFITASHFSQTKPIQQRALGDFLFSSDFCFKLVNFLQINEITLNYFLE